VRCSGVGPPRPKKEVVATRGRHFEYPLGEPGPYFPGTPPSRTTFLLQEEVEAYMANPRSTASIAGHPIHPMLVPFPIAFFVATFVCDLAFWGSGNPYWATVSLWLLGAGLVMAALAAIAGLIDLAGEPRIRELRDVWWHAGGNVLMVLIQLYNWFARYTEDTAALLPKGLILSLVAVGILLFTGWKGWQMVYRHHVGVSDEPDTRGHIHTPSHP
jgi:uncharacterized membrane protein